MAVLKIDELAEKFNIDTTSKAENTSVLDSFTSDYDRDAGKFGYQEYLNDLDKERNKTQAKEDETFFEKIGRYLGDGISDTTLPTSILTDVTRSYAKDSLSVRPQPSADWKEEEKYRFGDYYLTDREKAFEYAEAVNNKYKNEKMDSIAKRASSSVGSGIVNSVGSIGANLLAGATYLDILAQMAGRGYYVAPAEVTPSDYANAVQRGISTKLNDKYGTINEKVPILGGKGWGDAYGLGMSIAQSGVAAATGSQAFTLATFFGMSASQGVNDALSRGATSDQALLYGTVAGLAEAIPEMFSVSKLLKIGSADTMTSLFKSVLKQAGEEAGEEATTAVLTAIADGLIMGDKSNFNALVEYYVSQGMTREQAEKKALTQTIEDIAFDTIAGAASGTISAGGRAGALTAYDRLGFTQTNKNAKAVLGGKTAEMLEAGSKVQDKSAKKIIDKYGAKVKNGKELSGFELRNLNSKITEGKEADTRAKVKDAIKQRLIALGENAKNVEGLSNLILKKALGEDLTVIQNIRLNNSDIGTKVANEIDLANMQSGDFDSSWAKVSGVDELRRLITSEQQKTASAANNEATPANVSGLSKNAAKPQYKVNMESVKGKIDLEGNAANKIKFKKSSPTSKIHTDDIHSSLTKEDITNLTAIEKVANALGIDIYVYETTKQSDGTRKFSSRDGSETSANGWYDSSDGSIHIDLRAGQNGEGTMLFTAAHELTHFIKENSPEHFEALEKIVTEGFTKKGLSIDALIDKQIEKAKNDGREISREDAREEMIADACETMLANGSLVKKLSALKTENKGLWNAIKRFFDNLFNKIDKLYRTLKPDSAEGKYIADMRKTAKKLKAAFADALTAASEKKTTSPQNRGKIMFDARESLQNAAKSLEKISDDAYLEAKRESPFVLVMEHTPKIILDSLSNSKDRKILIRRDALYLAIRDTGVQDGHYHGLGADVLGDLPKYLEEPDVILSTKTENGEENQSRRLLLTHIPVKNGQAIISVEFETVKDFEGKNDYFNLVVTVFDLHENYLKRLFKKNSAVIKYEKEDLSQVNPQLYEWLRTINEKSSANSISHPKQNVNSKKTEIIKPSARSKNMSTGQINKLKANYTHEKVYSKKLAFDIISRFSSAGDFKAKTREAIAESLWEGLNSCTSIEERNKFAHDTAVFVVGKMLSESRANNPEAEAAREKLAYLRSGIQRITFSESDIEEIKHLRDVAGRRSIQSRWGYKKNSSGKTKLGYPMDVFVTDVSREMPGMEYLADMHPVEAFLAINDIYEEALATAKDKWTSKYLDVPDSEIDLMIQGVEELISDAFVNEGEKSKYTKFIENKLAYYKERAEFWKAERDNIKGRDRLLGLLTHKAQQLKDLKKGTFYNATQFNAEIFRDSIEKLANISYRGNAIQPKLIRGYFAELAKWYTRDNPMLAKSDRKEGDAPDLYNESIADAINYIALEQRNGFDKAELEMIYEIMSYFVKFIESYNKVFRQGKWVEALPIAKEYVKLLQNNPMIDAGLARTLAFKYDTLFMEPMTVAKRIDNYERGFYTEIVEELREAAKKASIAEMNIRADYDAFLKQHKEYVKTASAELVKYRGFDIPKMHLIGLYMTMKRKHAQAGLAFNGFAYSMSVEWWGKQKTYRVPGFIEDSKDLKQADFDAAVAAQISKLESLLTAADKEYIAILERMYNQDLRRMKVERDMERLGFSNATLDYYYPIARGNIAKNIDTTHLSDVNRATNASFNKNTVKGARQELVIINADALFNRHLHDICKYTYMSGAIENYNVLYNMDTADNPNHPVSVATESASVWKDDGKYFRDLISDLQGIPRDSSEGMAALRWIRSSYVKFQLGANLKVLVTQLSSLFASSSVLDFGSVVKGIGISSAGVDDYCEYAKLRHYDKTVIKAEGAIDKVSKWTDIFTKPISIMDNFVVGRLFGACQVQVQKDGGGKIGTEENKIAAGKLLEKVLLETQQNSMATERSAAMRTNNEVVRSLTMFRSDAMKITGRVIDAYGELKALEKKAKSDGSGTYDSDIKKAKKQLTKSVAALVSVAAFMAGIAQLFRWLYNKDDEEETVKTMLVDMGGNIIGGLPLLNDIYEYITNGYELDNFSYSAINDLLSSAVSLGKASLELFDEEDPSMEKINRYIRSFSYSVGQLFGLPTRNIYNMLYGFTKRFSSTAAYKVDMKFYEKNFKTDLEKAIEDGDGKKTELIMSLIYNEALGEDISKELINELIALAKDGKNVLPRDIPDDISRDGVEYELTSNQKQAIRDEYSKLHKALARLIKTSAYKKADNEKRAEMIAYYDNHYFNAAVNEALGIEDDKAIIYEAVGFDTYAKLHFATKDIISDKDSNGKTISGSKRKKVVAAINKLNISDGEKLLLIALKGYSLQDGDLPNVSAANAEKKLVKYMLSLKLTKSEKLELAEKCGFETKNGTIVLKNGKK